MTTYVPMTEDEQETRSCRYVMPRAMTLSSGAVVVLVDGQEPVFYQSWAQFADEGALPTYADLAAAQAPTVRRREPEAVEDDLADLFGDSTDDV